MSRVFSFRDLLRINLFEGLNEIDLLQIKNDDLVNSVLAELGFDITKPILYVPAKHRDLSGKVGVGFRAVGDIDPTDRKFLNSSLCQPIERLIAASKTDMSLCRELAKLTGSTVELRDDGAVDEADDYPDELTEPDEEAVAKQILVYENVRDAIRGTPYNEQGALKTPQEYQQA
jgi:hypothetical protein